MTWGAVGMSRERRHVRARDIVQLNEGEHKEERENWHHRSDGCWMTFRACPWIPHNLGIRNQGK